MRPVQACRSLLYARIQAHLRRLAERELRFLVLLFAAVLGSRARRPFFLLRIDPDAFKQYNDRYGHVAGEHCLAAVAAALKGALRRGGDQIVRYGGEQLAVLLPEP